MLIQAPMGISDGNCLSMFMRALDFSPRTMHQTVLVRDNEPLRQRTLAGHTEPHPRRSLVFVSSSYFVTYVQSEAAALGSRAVLVVASFTGCARYLQGLCTTAVLKKIDSILDKIDSSKASPSAEHPAQAKPRTQSST